MSIRLDDVLVATTMRTPGHDFELAAGFCFTDGLPGSAPVQGCRYCGTALRSTPSSTWCRSRPVAWRRPPTPRLGTVSSSCGLCGSTSLDELADRLEPLVGTTPIPLDVLAAVPDRVRAEQGLFDLDGRCTRPPRLTSTGVPWSYREDVGRHNASTRWSATSCSRACCRPASSGCTSATSLVRDRAEGVGRRVLGAGGGQRLDVVAGRGHRPAGRADAGRVRAGRAGQRLRP